MMGRNDFIDFLRVQKRYSTRTQVIYDHAIIDFCEFMGISSSDNPMKDVTLTGLRLYTGHLLEQGLSAATVTSGSPH